MTSKGSLKMKIQAVFVACQRKVQNTFWTDTSPMVLLLWELGDEREAKESTENV